MAEEHVYPEHKDTDTQTHPVIGYAKIGERLIAGVLLLLMFLVVAVTTVRLAIDFVGALVGVEIDISTFLVTQERFFDILGLFLAVLIGLELLETVVVYFSEHSLHAEVVVLVALVALARKIVLLDLGYYEPLTILGLSALTMALGATYFLLKRADTV